MASITHYIIQHSQQTHHHTTNEQSNKSNMVSLNSSPSSSSPTTLQFLLSLLLLLLSLPVASSQQVGTIATWQLINATTGNQGQVLVSTLSNETIIDLAQYPSNQLFAMDVLVNSSTTTNPVGSVRFQYDGRANFRTESSAPYALCGNSGTSYTPCPKLILVSRVNVTATPYSNTSATGIKGLSNSISFVVVNTTTTTKTPTKSPTKTPTNTPTIVATKLPTRSPTKTPTNTPNEGTY